MNRQLAVPLLVALPLLLASPASPPDPPPLPASAAVAAVQAAANVDDPQHIVATADPDAMPAPDGPRSIDCTKKVNKPHNSSHVGGTINVQVTMTCTYRVDRIEITASLWRGHTLLKHATGKAFNAAKSSANAPIACHAGTYHGQGKWMVVYPEGYLPRVQFFQGASAEAKIRCR
jgi:hypothetical protein